MQALDAKPTRSVPAPNGVVAAVVAIGLVITGLVTWTSWTSNNRNEEHLLKLQTEQAGEVLTAAVPDTEEPLATALEIASATHGSRRAFTKFMAPYLSPEGTFVSASLWQMTGANPKEVEALGAQAPLASTAKVRSTVADSLHAGGLIANMMVHGRQERLSFALALPGSADSYAVYAEHAIPADRKSSVASNAAFSDLNYAIYFGRSERQANLLTTSFTHFPIAGPTSKVSVRLGDATLTLVASPRVPLGGTLPARLPWFFAVLGVILSLATAWVAERIVRRRRAAERDASEIRRLYGELGALFGEQRTIAETLQRALLPRDTPDIAGMEVAVQYVPGAKGMEIGGDWYSVMRVDADHFAFVVGDVSGRGLSAATVMAGLCFTIRTYLLEGYAPSVVLEKCSKQIHVLSDGHFATVLIGIGDVRRREVTLANAGHFNPLVIDGDKTEYLDTVVGVPLGVSGARYESVTVTVPERSTLLGFTDGLVEHRGESLDVGLKRLAETARGAKGPLDLVLSKVIAELSDDTSEDDIAMLGLRWTS